MLWTGLAALALAGCASMSRGRAIPTGFVFDALDEGGTHYRYAVYVPRDYDPSRPWPLILFLHGSGESGTDGAKMIGEGLGDAIERDAAAWPFLVVFPQKPTEDSEWEEHDAALMAMLGRVRSAYNVDASRVYLTGLSQGGHGTWVLGAKHADTWAALASVCGYADTRRGGGFHGSAADLAPRLASIPMRVFHGEADDVVPVEESRALAEAVRAAGGDVQLTTFPGVNHGSWNRAYRDEHLAAWFLAHQKRPPEKR